jgi:SAM-dependent methyltransferase
MSMAVGLSAGSDPHPAEASVGGMMADDHQRPSVLEILRLLRCPVDNGTLSWDSSAQHLACASGTHTYPVEAGIPRLFAPNEWPDGRSDVTDIVKAFYEETPFPNYDGLDTRDSLRRKSTESVFGRLLDEQLPRGAVVLEIGCGTGQMTNFLGMGRARTVIGSDICLNSLGLGKAFRDRFSINNAQFLQSNLFRPPFAEASFDLVMSNGVLHHTSDCAGAFRSIARLVKPGGIIIIGLYNWLGRLPTLWWGSLINVLGGIGTTLGYRARDKGEAARRRAGLIDTDKHPHETRHSMTELLGWFDAAGFDYTASIPTIGDREFRADMRLFDPQPAGTDWDRLSSEIEMLLSGGVDGGLYIMIGRRRR